MELGLRNWINNIAAKIFAKDSEVSKLAAKNLPLAFRQKDANLRSRIPNRPE